MKRRNLLITLAIFLFVSVGVVKGQHFVPVWQGQNPYQPMNFIIQEVTIDGIDVEIGDEIAVFDDDGSGGQICVGSVVISTVPSTTNPAIFSAAHEENGGDGFITGNTIIYKIWDSSESVEITMTIPTYFGSPYDEVYTPQGTAFLTSLAGFSAVETTAESVTTCQGSVFVPISVSNFNNVGELNLVLDYQTANLTYVNYQNVDPSLAGLSVNENSGTVTIYLNTTPAVSISDGTILELEFTANTVLTQTGVNLTWDDVNSYYNDGNDDSMQTSFVDGVVTIDPIPQAAGSITGSTSVCQGTAAESYQISNITNATSYSWSLSPANAGTINGQGTTITIDFSATYSGQATLEVYGTNSCGDGTSNSINIQVVPNPTANAGSNATICENQIYTLSGTATNQQSVVWNSNGDGSFDNSTLLAATYTPGANDISNGTVTLTLTAIANTPCSNDAVDNMILSIDLLATANAGDDASICENETYQLSGTATNYNTLSWTSSGDGSFDDDSALDPIYTPGTTDIQNGTVTLTFEATGSAPCSFPISDNMTLSIQSLPTVNAGSDDNICVTIPTYTLSGTATNQQSVLWTTSGDGSFNDDTSLTPIYTTGTADQSIGSVILTLTATPVAPCADNVQDNMTLTLSVLPTANAGLDDDICVNETTYQVSGATANDYTSLAWTTSGDGSFVDGTVLNPVYTPGATDHSNGSVTLTLTASSVTSCDGSDDMVLSFTDLPTSNAGSDASICEDATYQLSGTATNYSSLLWTSSGDGSFDDDTALNPVYTPGATDISGSSVTLTLTSYATSPCTDDASDDMILSIGVLPIANAGSDDIICTNTTSYTLSGASATNQSSVSWTSSGDGTFTDATVINAEYNPGSGDIANGIVTLTLTASAMTPCTADSLDSMDLTFSPLPTSDAGTDADICEDVSYQLSGVATEYGSVLWTSSGDGVFDDDSSLTPIYTPGSTDIANATVTLTLTAYAVSPCSDDASDDMELGIILHPIADAGADDSMCESSTSYTTAGTTTGDVASTLWTTSGDGTFDDATALVTEYTPGTNDIDNGNVTLTLTVDPLSPCATSDSDDIFLEIQQEPTAYAGDDGNACEGSEYQLSGSAENQDYVVWTTTGDGTFDDETSLNAIYTPGPNDGINGNVDIELTAYAILPCSNEATDIINIVVQPLANPNAGEDDGICTTETYQLDGSVDNYVSFFWATSGDGLFSDISVLDPVYTPGTNDIASGSVELSLTATSISPCQDDVTDFMILSISGEMPGIPSLPEGPQVVDLDITSSSVYTTSDVENADTYNWFIFPDAAGTIAGNDTEGTVQWDMSYTGLIASVYVVAGNGCGESISDTLDISVSPVGVINNIGGEMVVTLAPNPSNGVFNIIVENANDDIDLYVINSSGKVVLKNKLLNTAYKTVNQIDLSNRSKGTYYIKLIMDDAVIVRKALLK